MSSSVSKRSRGGGNARRFDVAGSPLGASLPPRVQGACGGEVEVSVLRLTWYDEEAAFAAAAVKNSGEKGATKVGVPGVTGTHVSIMFWGQDPTKAKPAVLKPLVRGAAKENEAGAIRTMWFPICTRPEQFCDYLRHMKSMRFDVHGGIRVPCFALVKVSETFVKAALASAQHERSRAVIDGSFPVRLDERLAKSLRPPSALWASSTCASSSGWEKAASSCPTCEQMRL